MKKNYSVTFKIEPRTGKGKSTQATHSFFAESLDRAKQLANYFKYVMYDRNKLKVTMTKATKK